MAIVTISVPDDLNERIKIYNKENPYNKIVVSMICQGALFNEIEKRTN